MSVSGPKLKTFLRELVFGTPAFPGRLQCHRIATMGFSTIAADRRDLVHAFRQLSKEDLLAVAPILYEKLLIPSDVETARKALSAFTRPQNPTPELGIEHYHFRKTLSYEKLAAICVLLNEKLGREIFFVNAQKKQFWVQNQPLEPVPETSPEEKPALGTVIIDILNKSRPLTLATLRTLLAEQTSFTEPELETAKSELYRADTARTTSDGLIYLTVRQTALIQSGSLVVVQTQNRPISRQGFKVGIASGQIVEVHTSKDPIYLPKKHFEAMHSGGQICEVYEESDRVCYFLHDELGNAEKAGKIVLGKRGEAVVLILTTPESLAFHSRDIYCLEAQQLLNALEQRGELIRKERESFNHSLEAVYELWEQAGVHTSVYRNTYLAKKLAPGKGTKTTVLAALLYAVPYSALRDNPLSGIVKPGQREEVLKMVEKLKIARGIPFALPAEDRHFLQNRTWYLMIFMGGVGYMEALLYDKLRALVYQPASVTPQEIKFCSARLAQRLELLDLADDLSNLAFKAEAPDTFTEYEGKIQAAIGMSLQEAKRYLADFAGQLREELAALGIPREVLRIHYHRKTEASVYDKTEVRAKYGFEEVWDLLQVRITIDSQTGRDEEERERENLRLLEIAAGHLRGKYMQPYGLTTAEVDDYISQPLASGFQTIALKAKGPQEKRVEIQVMTQRMYENQSFLRVRQMASVYAVQRSLQGQEFDDYPYELLTRLTGNPEHDYPLIVDYLTSHWVFVFFVKLKDPSLNPRRLSKRDLLPLITEGKIELQMKRLPRGATPPDLASRIPAVGQKGEKSNLVSRYGGAEIYHFGFDPKTEAPVIAPYDQREGILPNWGVDYHLQTGDIVFLRAADAPFGGKEKAGASEALPHSKTATAIISLRRLLNEQSLKEDERRGERRIAETFSGMSMNRIGVIAGQYKFLTLGDFYAAIGSDLIPLTEIEEVHSRVSVRVESSGKESLMRIKAPERRGLIKFLFNYFPLHNHSLRHLYSGNPYFLLGEKRSEIILEIDPQDTNTKALREGLLTFVDTQSDRDFPAETFPYTIQVVSSSGQWNHLQSLIDELWDLERSGIKINIRHANLPPAKPGKGEIFGTLEIEMPASTTRNSADLELVLHGLKNKPGVVEIT